ncbi:RecQ family ATP-dependent DNA helicase [Robiginitalea sp. IMCC44478]|uniref:RecQ family ATP-dependent DNA helicase n=1 Tax=Robiginitalea sp. IMCC44478 TaxID=3459122 RepID=UPI00404341AE
MNKDPHYYLRQYWGFESFQGSQLAIIRSLMEHRDVLGLLPTGGGKSLCYQLPALAMEGICLVISPLVALMEDQIANLKARNIKAMGLFGKIKQQELTERLDNAQFGNYKFLYLSPERLRQEIVLERLKYLDICLIAVDEAHCISQWGFDFRPAYLECAVLKEVFPQTPMIALTATATENVIADIQQSLHMKDPLVFRDSIERPNISYRVLKTADKDHRLQQLLKNIDGSAIIYVQTRRKTKSLSDFLTAKGISSSSYHGGLLQDQKTTRLEDWLLGKKRVMVATNAFGMGIDKSDVRLVVHYEVPETLEHYVQEAGRAGRDGLPAWAVLLVAPGDLKRAAEFFLGNIPEIKEVVGIYRHLCNYFQVSYGEMPEHSFPMDFSHFCERYGLQQMKAYNTLEILDRQEVIRLSQQSKTSASLKFICSKQQLWDYIHKNPGAELLIKSLLRTYGGLFDFTTSINTRLLGAKVGIAESSVIRSLQQFEKYALIELQLSQGDMELSFTRVRQDEKTIYAFSGQLKARQKIKKEKVAQMALFLRASGGCRQNLIREYFGEPQGDRCGQCDLCLQDAPEIHSEPEMRDRIMSALKERAMTSRELSATSAFPEPELLSCLQQLLQEGRLRLGRQNEYILN